MKKNNVAQRPSSFNQPFVNSNRSKVSRQSCLITFSSEMDSSVSTCNLPMQDNKILKTPTTPQFPMPDTNRPFINEILHNDFDHSHFNDISIDTGSEDFPWTPDTPSSDTKDPLMTNAVNTECSSFLVFPQKSISLDGSCISQSYHINQQFQSFDISAREKFQMQSFNSYSNDLSSLSQSPEIVICQKKNFNDVPFDMSTFNFPPNTALQSIANKRSPRLHLLQFIYCLLNSSKPTQCVCWVDKDECVFRIINPNKLTSLWGRYKQNPNMSFDSLSRSLRLYYASGRLERVTGQRNQYRFVNREESIDFNRRNKRKNQQFSMDTQSASNSLLNTVAVSNHANHLTFIPKPAVIKNSKLYCNNNSLSSHSIVRQLL